MKKVSAVVFGISLVVWSMCLSNVCDAADWYVGPGGEGDGTTLEDAAHINRLGRVISEAAAGDTIHLGSGNYVMNGRAMKLNKSLTFLGPNAGVPGGAPDRKPEAVFYGATGVTTLVEVNPAWGAKVTFDGFEFTGKEAQMGVSLLVDDNPAKAKAGIPSITFKFANNIVRGVDTQALSLCGGAAAQITNNRFIACKHVGVMVYTDTKSKTTVANNEFNNVSIGVFAASTESDVYVTTNTMTNMRTGVVVNGATVGKVTVSGNKMSGSKQWDSQPDIEFMYPNSGIVAVDIEKKGEVHLLNNTISDFAFGMTFWGLTASNPLTANGGTIVQSRKAAVYMMTDISEVPEMGSMYGDQEPPLKSSNVKLQNLTLKANDSLARMWAAPKGAKLALDFADCKIAVARAAFVVKGPYAAGQLSGKTAVTGVSEIKHTAVTIGKDVTFE